jgi:hypothetical protein
MEHDDLNHILVKRAAPPRAPYDLAERIIHAAVSTIPSRMREMSFLEDFRSLFLIPRPALAFACAIAIGIIAGFQTGEGFSSVPDWSSFLDVNEGGWL